MFSFFLILFLLFSVFLFSLYYPFFLFFLFFFFPIFPSSFCLVFLFFPLFSFIPLFPFILSHGLSDQLLHSSDGEFWWLVDGKSVVSRNSQPKTSKLKKKLKTRN